MGLPLWADNALLTAAGNLLTYMQTGVSLHLFQNVFSPAPDSPGSAFHESSFPGYSAVNLGGLLSGPTLVVPGQYELTTTMISFTCTGATSQVIAGWYMRRSVAIVAAEAFTTPIPLANGTQYTIQLRPQLISQSLL